MCVFEKFLLELLFLKDLEFAGEVGVWEAGVVDGVGFDRVWHYVHAGIHSANADAGG